MAKQKTINKRCPLAPECGRKTCEHVSSEHKCDYYKYNARDGFTIPDQEAILEQQRKQLEMDLDNALIQDALNELDTKDKLVYLSVDALSPHPHNPRKELGDLTELANSIKEKGVMQNLTVVPGVRDGCYTVIIGHRRLAAAKAAGLETVPCIIVEMSYEEQIATMLLENMQRSDLTLYEQAQGFQMMIDFGETPASISKKTGLSESTVRRRVKLAELDQNTLKKVSARQISIGDLDRLNEIEDEKERNRVLAHIGTNNFESELKKAKDAQERQKNINRLKEALSNIDITEIESQDHSTQRYEDCFSYNTGIEKGIEFVKELIEKGKKCFIQFNNYSFYIFTEKQKPSLDSQDSSNGELDDEVQKEQERQNRLRQLKEIRKSALMEAEERAYSLRSDFIKKFTEAKAKEHLKEISIMMSKANWSEFGIYDYDHEKYMNLMGLAYKEETNYESYEEIQLVAESLPHKSLLVNAYIVFEDGKRAGCHSQVDLTYSPSVMLETLYECLKSLGYEMSDEEIELLTGKSPLYLNENE